jgi:DNA-nicking Smr family endonuclease
VTKSKPPGDSSEDAAAFTEAVRGARKLGGPHRVSPDLAARDPVTPGQVRRYARASPMPARLLVVRSGETWTARADGVDPRVVRKLRDGAIPVEDSIDLHGLTRAQAAEALDRFVAAARAGGRRCLLVIHGRGLHSGQTGPALGEVVRELAAGGAHADAVLACTSAAPARGGPGATVVYLRR